jgi:hypothetical protein
MSMVHAARLRYFQKSEEKTMTDKRLTLWIAVLAAMLLAACAQTGAGDTPTDPTQEPTSEDNTPPVFFVLDDSGRAIPGQIASWCWEGNCIEAVTAPIIDSYFATTNPLILSMQQPSPNKLILALSPASGDDLIYTDEIVPDGDSVEWATDVPGGDYTLTVTGQWNDGSDVIYHFGVNLPETDEPGSNELTTEPTSNGGDDTPTPPVLTLILPSGEAIPATQGTYCWSGDGAGLCVDMIWPPLHDTFTPIPLAAQFSFAFAENPPASVTINLYRAGDLYGSVDVDPIFEPLDTVDVEVGADGAFSWRPQIEPGEYVIMVQAYWPDQGGDSMYSFAVGVQ